MLYAVKFTDDVVVGIIFKTSLKCLLKIYFSRVRTFISQSQIPHESQVL